MSIETQEFLYEILIRFGPDGYVGSHKCDLQKIEDTETGEVLVERELAAVPLPKEGVQDLLNAETVDLLSQLDRSISENESLHEKLIELNDQLQIAADEKTAIAERLQTAEGENAALQEKLSTLGERLKIEAAENTAKAGQLRTAEAKNAALNTKGK